MNRCEPHEITAAKYLHLVMDVTIGHTYSFQNDFKPNTLREMESNKCWKYQRFPSDNV